MWQDRCIERRCSTTGSTWLSNRPQGGASHTQRHVNSADGGGSESNHVSDIGAALLGKMIGEHTTQQYTEVKTIISKDSQVAPKRMQLAVRLAVNTHNMGERFVESVKNARCSMSLQKAGDGLEIIVEFQVQIKGHNSKTVKKNCKACKIGLMKSLQQS